MFRPRTSVGLRKPKLEVALDATAVSLKLGAVAKACMASLTLNFEVIEAVLSPLIIRT